MSDALPHWDMSREMNHEEIAARNVVDRYVMGSLSTEEAVRFEEHFVDCAACLDQMETAERFRVALKNVASESASVGLLPAAPRRSIAWQVAAALVIGLGATLGASLFFSNRQTEVERELATARAAAQQWHRRYEALRVPEPTPLVVSTFYLTIPRGAESAAPVNRVTVGADAGWVALSLEGEADAGSLRVNVTDSAGTGIWQGEVNVTPHAALSVVMPRGVLRPGDYTLTLETLSGGLYRAAGRYHFRVVGR